jgi:hypothetical protein
MTMFSLSEWWSEEMVGGCADARAGEVRGAGVRGADC